MVVAVAVAVIVRVAAEASTPTFSSPRDSAYYMGQGPRRQQLHSEARAGRGGTIRRPQLPAGRTTSGVGIGNCGAHGRSPVPVHGRDAVLPHVSYARRPISGCTRPRSGGLLVLLVLLPLRRRNAGALASQERRVGGREHVCAQVLATWPRASRRSSAGRRRRSIDRCINMCTCIHCFAD